MHGTTYKRIASRGDYTYDQNVRLLFVIIFYLFSILTIYVISVRIERTCACARLRLVAGI